MLVYYKGHKCAVWMFNIVYLNALMRNRRGEKSSLFDKKQRNIISIYLKLFCVSFYSQNAQVERRLLNVSRLVFHQSSKSFIPSSPLRSTRYPGTTLGNISCRGRTTPFWSSQTRTTGR